MAHERQTQRANAWLNVNKEVTIIFRRIRSNVPLVAPGDVW